jgi:peptide/nickel transport system substrate-binding protein
MSSNKLYQIFALVLAVAILLSACSTPTAAPTAVPQTAPTSAPAATKAPAATSAPAATTAPAATSAPAATAAAPAGNANAVLTLAEQTMPTFTRNYNPFTTTALPGTLNVIHEPMMILNSVKGELVPWLATGYKWSDDLKTLTFTIRDGVKWSDAQPFTAADVAFTFNLLKTKTGVNSASLSALTGASAFVDTITAPDAKSVVFTFKRVYTPGLYELITQNIVPEHIWKDVKDVVAYTNDNPVGTGPFTQIANFTPQAYEVDKNPNYWMAGKPAFKGIVYKAYADANAAALAMANGDIDWSNLAISDPANNFVAKDPKNKANRYFMFEEGPNMAILAMNINRKPFDDVNVRKAVSMAINRDQISTVGESGVVSAADVTGLSNFFKAWKVSDPTKLADWATYNVDKANQLLDAAGLKKGADGIRVANGKPMKYEVMVLPSPNWIADLQIAAENLKDVGIQITVKPNPNYPEWLKTQMTGNFDMIFSIIDGNATPYRTFRMTLSKELLADEGKPAQGNYNRYAGGKAEDLLTKFAASTDLAQQKQVASDLQKIFAQEVPAVPLTPVGGMGLVNTTRFSGFPAKDNYYASAQPNPSYFADCLLVLTQITPK